MTNEQASEGREKPYALLDQIHKTVEELRKRIAEQENYIANIEKAIENYYISIFKEEESNAK